MDKKTTSNKKGGFSLVELVIVIVIIGILATVATISYSSVRKRVDGESLKSDLISASSKLAKFKADNGKYPATIDCAQADSDTNLCIKTSTTDVVLRYNVNTATSPDSYGLTGVKNNDNDISFRTATGSEPILCPVGYIVVPGSKTYGTGSFCVMKYEAKQIGTSGMPISTPSDPLWVNIPQTDAISVSTKVCAGCHLISEAEWMTLSQNVLNVASNWSGGAVGNGYIYSGNNDGAPASSLAASSDDTAGYFGTDNVSPSNQRRTLTLTNGEVVWDLAGNVYDWTSGQAGSNQQPGVTGAGLAVREFTAITNPGTLAVNPLPSGLGIAGAETWTATKGIGRLYSNADETSTRGIPRGGCWDDINNAGILYIHFNDPPWRTDPRYGFRVSASQ